MNINVDYASTLKRRVIIASAIVPFTFVVAAQGAWYSVARMWRDAAYHWKPRETL